MANAIPRIVVPTTLTASNNVFTFTAVMPGPTSRTYTCTLTSGTTYYDLETFLAMVKTKIEAATRAGPVAFSADGGSATVTISAAGYITIAVAGLAATQTPGLTLSWSTNAVSQAAGTLLGFGTADTTENSSGGGTASETAANQMQNYWYPGEPCEWDPTQQPGEYGYVATNVRSMGGQGKTHYFGSLVTRRLRFKFLQPYKIWTARETAATTANQAWQRIVEGVGRGGLRYYPDATVLGTGNNSLSVTADIADASANNAWRHYYLLQPSLDRINAERFSHALDRWSLDLDFGAYQV